MTYRRHLTTLLIAFFFLIVGSLTTLFINRQQEQESRKIEAANIEEFLNQAKRFERRIIDNVPIYEDWATPEREIQLRKHLLADHLAVVNSMKLEPILDQIEIDTRVKNGSLQILEQNRETPYFFYNVKKENRVLAPMAAEGILLITKRLNNATDGFIKIAISSATRSIDYQGTLRNRNPNASLVSSHSYGISFDIFYDSFFISFPMPTTGNTNLDRSLESLRIKVGFWLGDALRRQLHSLLAEILIQLQNEGKLYAILEKNQRCYHVTIRPQ